MAVKVRAEHICLDDVVFLVNRIVRDIACTLVRSSKSQQRALRLSAGTFAPDTDNRWMGSIAMDKSGNMRLGYSVSSSATLPSIRYTGWVVGNPLGTLQMETQMVGGSGSQTGYNRWAITRSF